MPSILDQKFEHSVLIPAKFRGEIQAYMERNVGGRTYWLSSRVGGKQWCLWNRDSGNDHVKLEFNGDQAQLLDQEITMLLLRA